MKQPNDLITLSNSIADTVWSLVQFWGTFSQTIIGNRFVQVLDETTILATQMKKVKKDEKKLYKQKITMLISESLVWLDKARRRRLLANDEYQNLYKQIKFFASFLKAKS